jgi:hypothetical protein
MRCTRERDTVVGNVLKQLRPLRLTDMEVKVKVWDHGEAWDEAERSPFAWYKRALERWTSASLQHKLIKLNLIISKLSIVMHNNEPQARTCRTLARFRALDAQNEKRPWSTSLNQKWAAVRRVGDSTGHKS